MFFGEQSIESLQAAIAEFDTRKWNADTCRANAERFSTKIFRDRFQQFVEGEWERFTAVSTGAETHDAAPQGTRTQQLLPA